jgi:hypothetical protein
MTGLIPQASRRRGALFLADISGYTSFLQGVADAHRALIIEADEPPAAYGLVSSLLDSILVAIAPTFRLAKFEGDAIFAVSDDEGTDGQAVLECLHRCYASFRHRLAAAGSEWTCTCDACARIGELDLKFIVHHGTYVVQPIAGHSELLGPDVNLVHRLLKNNAREVVGSAPYALLTEAAVEALGIPTGNMVGAQEAYDGGAPVQVHLLVLAHSSSAFPSAEHAT